MSAAAARPAGADAFRYEGFDIDRGAGTLRCTYAVGGRRFEERISAEGDWRADGVEAAARLVFLLAGVSYYKAFAPPVLHLGEQPAGDRLRRFLREYHLHGLAEFAYRNGLDLHDLRVLGGTEAPAATPADRSGPVRRPLIPFGGGMDSAVSVEIARETTPDAALFVVSREGDRYGAIEAAAAVTGLPVLRAWRELDPQVLRSAELGLLNGHVPVTGIISALAVLGAVLDGRDAVVMSNERSASVATIEHEGRPVNHQWSKSLEFETGFRDAVAASVPDGPTYFSLLRPFSELWIARRFAARPAYLPVFRSCNRAFHLDPAARLDRWCGRCDKCAFVDLVLSPYVARRDLAAVFDGDEPLDDADLLEVFRTLLGTGGGVKPFECVGDEDECRTAVALARQRPDRAGSQVLDALAADLDVEELLAAAATLLEPRGPHHVPEPYASALRLV